MDSVSSESSHKRHTALIHRQLLAGLFILAAIVATARREPNGRDKMKRKMARPFRIHVNSIAAEPLSVQETVRKYRVSPSELKKVKSFVSKRRVSAVEPSDLTSADFRKRKVTSNGRKAHRGHK